MPTSLFVAHSLFLQTPVVCARVQVTLPADRTRGLYLLTAPEESAYLPKTRSHDLNTVLLEAVLQRLLNDHAFNEVARLVSELQV